MEKCEFCGTQLPADASFCGNCGQVPYKASHQATLVSDGSIPLRNEIDEQPTIQNAGNLPDKNQLSSVGHGSIVLSDEIDDQPTVNLPDEIEATLIIEPGAAGMLQENTPTMLLPPAEPASLDEKTDEEEKRRRAALLGIGIPLLGALADAAPGQIPSIPGTPQIAHVASLQGTPQIVQPGTVPGQALGPGTGTPTPAPSSPAPGSSPPTSLPGGSGSPGSGSAPGGSGSPGTGSTPGGSGSPGSSPGGPSGCLVAAIIVITTLMLILTSIITLGLTLWAPGLTLHGSSTVSPGSTLMLRGSNFLPNSSVDLTLDSNISLYYLQRTTPAQLASSASIRRANSASQLLQFLSQGKKTIVVQGNGTFTIPVPVDPSAH